jgi:hypothetical protein
LAAPWRERITQLLAVGILNEAQQKSLVERFGEIANIAKLLERFAKASESAESRNELEDLNLACRTLLSMNPRIDEEVSTWALLAGSKPRNAEARIRGLGLDVLLGADDESVRMPRLRADRVRVYVSAVAVLMDEPSPSFPRSWRIRTAL